MRPYTLLGCSKFIINTMHNFTDWGAILMVDDRYSKNKRYINSLSKWVRSDVIHHSNFNSMLALLEPFVKDMIMFDEENRKIDEATLKYNSVNENTSEMKKGVVGWRSKESRSGEFAGKKRKNQGGNPKIQYESDSSNDGFIENKGDMNKTKNTTSKKSKDQFGIKERTTPRIGSFKGPKNRSEFFSKTPKQEDTCQKPRAFSSGNVNGINFTSDKVGYDNLSPSARLASLAAFAVKKNDTAKNDTSSPHAIVDQAKNYTSNNLECQKSVLNSTNIPSNIKLHSNIPSNIVLSSEISTNFSKHQAPSTPLTDITSSNEGNVTNITSSKKKFKFSPAVKDTPVLPSNDNCIQSSETQRKLISNRYIPGKFQTKYDADSDDDFQ